MRKSFLLVTTQVPNLTKVWACHGFSQLGNALPPVDLTSIAAVISRNNCDVKIMELRHLKNPLEILKNEFKYNDYDYFVTNVNTASASFDYEMVRVVPAEVKKIAFGTHAAALPQELLNNGFDACLLGDPEKCILELIEGKALDEAQGVVTINALDKPPAYIDNLDALPFPLISLLDIAKYRLNFLRGRPATYLLSNRGCPFTCNFCSIFLMHGRQFRTRSAINIKHEIIHNAEMFDVRDFYFVDPTFNSSKERVLEVCEAIKESGVDVAWGANMRITPFDEEMAQSMKAAGCRALFFGVEDTEKLDEIHKKVNQEQVTEAFRIAKKYKLISHMLWMLFPDGAANLCDYRKRVLKAVDEIKADYFQCSIVMPLPGTELYEAVLERSKNKDWSKFNIGTLGKLPYNSPIDLVKLKNQIYFSYFLRHPGKLVRLFFQIPFRLVALSLIAHIKSYFTKK